MSFFGKNIRKIRSLRGLSQQEFGELFSIKRGTLGAYEEGRSEPKIDTVIRVANHFSIPIGDLLTKELTVNQLSRFNDGLILQPDELAKVKFATVPCIIKENSDEYAENFDKQAYINSLPAMQLPINLEKKFRALTVFNLEMTNYDNGFYPNDVVIGEFVPQDVSKKLNNGTLVFGIVHQQLIFRRLYSTNTDFVFRADHKGIDDIVADLKDIQELWRVRYVFFRRLPELSNGVDEKFDFLERQIKELSSKLK